MRLNNRPVGFYVYRGSDFSGEEYSADFAGLESCDRRVTFLPAGTGSRGRAEGRPERVIAGTRAGYLMHLRRGEKPCEACRRGLALYMQSYRLLHPGLDQRRRHH